MVKRIYNMVEKIMDDNIRKIEWMIPVFIIFIFIDFQMENNNTNLLALFNSTNPSQ